VVRARGAGGAVRRRRALAPAGVAQSDELDYTVHSPVTIAPVVMP
jgi:hypothetical protein